MTKKVLAAMFVSTLIFPRILAGLDVDIDSLAGKEWYGLYFGGEKAGYAMNEISVGDAGQIIIVEDARFMITMQGVRQDMRIFSRRTYEAEGALSRIEYEVEHGSGTNTFEAEVEGDTMTLRTSLGGEVSVQELPAPEESLADALKLGRLVRDEPAIGDELSYSLFEPLYQREITGVSRIVDRETRILQGVDTNVYKIETVLEPLGLTTTSYVTEHGLTLEDQVDLLTMRLEPEELAKDVDYSNDVIVSNAALLDAPIENPRDRDTLALRIDGPLGEDHLFNDERQTLEPANGHFRFEGRLLDVEDIDPPELPVTDEGVAEWLEPTPFVQSDHERVRAKAEDLLDGETNAWEAARKLNAWVSENVRTTFSAQLSNTLDVLEHMEGDCTEHSVLFIGLARAAGIPAREVAGLIYVEGPDPGFYFHQWAKVWVGKWVDMDPTFGQDMADATHIKLSEGDLFEQNRLLPLIGQIDVDVIEE